MDSGNAELVPRCATLDGFAREARPSDSIDLRAAEPLVPILVTTKNSLYRIIPLRRGETAVMVHGGRFFPSPAQARLIGATFGGSLLKMNCIRVGMCMELDAGPDDGRITTTRVLDIQFERNQTRPN